MVPYAASGTDASVSLGSGGLGWRSGRRPGGTRKLLAWTALAVFGLGAAEAFGNVLIPAAREALARERHGPPGLK